MTIPGKQEVSRATEIIAQVLEGVESLKKVLGDAINRSLRQSYGDIRRTRSAAMLIGYEYLIDEFPRLIDLALFTASTTKAQDFLQKIYCEEIGKDVESGESGFSHAVLFRQITDAMRNTSTARERWTPLANRIGLGTDIYAALKPILQATGEHCAAGLITIYALYHLYQEILMSQLIEATRTFSPDTSIFAYFKLHSDIVMSAEDALVALKAELEQNPDAQINVESILNLVKILLLNTFRIQLAANTAS